jgi:GntR family transcriptional regulator, carbon starvation induced regulator
MEHALQSAHGLAIVELPRSGNRSGASNQIVGSRHSVTRVRPEILALRMAIERGGAEWEATILAAHHRLSRHLRTPERLVDETWEKLHRAFHLALIEACGSRRHLSFCLALHDHFDRYRRIAVGRSGRHPTIKSSRADLVAAAIDKDSDRAAALLTEHIEESAAAFVELAGPQGFSCAAKAST